MKIKKVMAITLAAVLVCAAGCSSQTAEPQSEAAQNEQDEEQSEVSAEETTTEEIGGTIENPVLNYIGAYSDENGSGIYLYIDAADETDGVLVDVAYPEEDAYTYWSLYGKIAGNTITYSDGCKYDVNPTTGEETLVYSDGTGKIEISADNKVTWKDDKEDAGKDFVFAWDEELNQQIWNQIDDSAQNPTMNWAGPYADTNDKNRTMQIQSGSEGTSDCTVTVTETTSLEKTTVWTMAGVFVQDTMSIDYTDCVKKEVTLDADGNPVSEETVYEDGTGSFVINPDDQTITWTDDKEDAGSGSHFVFRYDYGEASTGEGAIEEEPDEITVEQ